MRSGAHSSRPQPLRDVAFALLFLLLGSIAAPPMAVCEDSDLDDIMEGFEDEEEITIVEEPSAALASTPRFWDVDGSLSVTSSINYLEHDSPTGTDYSGMQKLRTRLNLEFDFDLPHGWKARAAGYAFYDFAYLLHGRSDYTDDVLDEYEWEANTQDVYVQGRIRRDLDLKVGRQVVNWGRSETLRVLDVLNPLDLRQPGLADIEDLLLPVTMLRLDYHFSDWALSAIAIPEIRFGKWPPVGSDFYPSADPLPHERTPSESLDNTEWAASLKGIFHGWDISFHFARYWDELPYIAPVAPTGANPLGLVSKHGRVTMSGAGGNYTIGSWLLKGELAYLGGVDYTVGQVVDGFAIPTGTEEKSRIDVMGGVEYYGFTEKTLVFEVANRHIDDFEERMRPFNVQENALETSVRLTADYLHDRLHVIALAVIFGERAQDGSVVRVSADYDLRDALAVGGGILLFQGGDLLELSTADDNDRLFFEVRYSF